MAEGLRNLYVYFSPSAATHVRITKHPMYIQTVRSLYENGAVWRSYDEAFRSLRQANNWGWESVCWFLWMNASQSRPAATPSGSPFRSKGKASWGKAKWPSTKTCFAFDRGGMPVMQQPVATHIIVDAMVAPTQRHGVIGSKPTLCPTDISHKQLCGPIVECQFATSRFQEIVCLHKSLLMHFEMSLSATIIILSMGLNTVSELAALFYRHHKIKGSPI